MFFVFMFFVCDDFFPRAGRAHATQRLRSAGHLVRGASPVILSILFGFFWPSGVSPSSSSSSSSSFLLLLLLLLPLGGWAPLAAFSLRFPPVSRVGGGCVLCFFALQSSILRLLCRSRLGQPGVRARKPPGPHRACTPHIF